jgi:hypothetical protein
MAETVGRRPAAYDLVLLGLDDSGHGTMDLALVICGGEGRAS